MANDSMQENQNWAEETANELEFMREEFGNSEEMGRILLSQVIFELHGREYLGAIVEKIQQMQEPLMAKLYEQPQDITEEDYNRVLATELLLQMYTPLS